MENAGTYKGETVQGIYLSCMVRAGQGGFDGTARKKAAKESTYLKRAR